MRDKVVDEVRSFYKNDLEGKRTLHAVRDSVGSRPKGVQNIWKKSIIEKMYKQAKGRKRNALFSASKIRTYVRLSMKENVSKDMGKFLHISDNQDDMGLGIHVSGVVETQKFITVPF